MVEIESVGAPAGARPDGYVEVDREVPRNYLAYDFRTKLWYVVHVPILRESVLQGGLLNAPGYRSARRAVELLAHMETAMDVERRRIVI